jgi:hypothetical protein
MGRPLIGDINRGAESSVAKLLIPKLLSKNLDGTPNGRPSSFHRLSFLDRGPAKKNSGGILGGVQHKIFTNVLAGCGSGTMDSITHHPTCRMMCA